MRRDSPSPSPSRFCFLTFLVKVKVNNSGRFYDDFVAVMEGFEQTVEVNWVPVICLYVSRAQRIDRIVLRIALSVFARAPHPLFKTTTSQLGSDVHIVVVRTFTLSDLLFQRVICVLLFRSRAYLYCSSTFKWDAWTSSTTITTTQAALDSGLI